MDNDSFYLNKLVSLNNYLNYNLWFINFCNLFVGLYFIVVNYESHKNYSGCGELYNFLCINVGLTSIPVLTCSSIYEINFLYFIGMIYLIYRDIMLINRCYNEYENTYYFNYFNYFIASSAVLIFNELIYLIKFSLLIRTSYFSRKIKNYNAYNKKQDISNQPVISSANNYNLNEIAKNFSNKNQNKKVDFDPINSVNNEKEPLLNSDDTNLYDTINEINEPNNMYE